MFEPVEVYQKDGKVLKIFHDDCNAESPRDWDNLGTMICFHRRYNLGDPHDHGDKDEFLFALLEEAIGDTTEAKRKLDNIRAKIDRKEFRKYGQYDKAVDDAILEIAEKCGYIILPLYLYDHGGLTMRTYPFSCPWDSGQVGWIYVGREKIRKEYGVKHVTKKVRDRVVAALESEVKTYSQWIEGDVYGFVLEDDKGNKINSCWGFFGTDWKKNGIVECAGEEWRAVVN
ncbi:MAG: hypothetical protein A4E53_01543 [Pelotomaculum sp. PtaB.Bin104]|nr:MAG: hypothetical protein A4E53_01543 [Pelotomaculum sp. PtaB.Bin104]